MKRIIMHWTAGWGVASNLDREHYHAIVEGDGNVVYGRFRPEDNESTATTYAAHTRGLNTGSIGLAMAGMVGATEKPFYRGKSPINMTQLTTFADIVAEMALTYDIPVTRRTVLTHAEVEPTLGVWQRGKWDINWLPGENAPLDPIEAGDRLRSLVKLSQLVMAKKSIKTRIIERLVA
ncbi:MAG: peptidoglycan recognition protein family protein [Alphaproteobacteria bacterium]|uniref:Putative N-acetylmuramoyl-L-alanine amidase n=1 Tax=viral metagenome TaxID=1070528 RepID=A0A6M3JL22_9ZZZZ|nr:peptidoglycan recognition protein family protein [Alphaproteobacteria bacterium]MBU1829911.1 peptidoglycan recognition protein family protein [Alphaproteobacteria bacterium]MBU2079949.1 peptidoglycan recognition protein family protein [Alphaproteobacteria bacterium]MBU2162723.1 peptidoglycan recognition protein family protein [Alphaproteobacteria bacterium]MBU2244138.1 peptidoglycan recognition protein family protein [Alphaproteobacteria bacterium]